MIVELRQYTLHPGQRDVLIELFEREFVASQEAVGMTLIRWFRDDDDPDNFVWLRAFPDMADRPRALAAFYDGPVWAEHRDAANATMVDVSNVLLLRPLRPGAGFALPRHTASVVVSIHHVRGGDEEHVAERLDRELGPAWATLVTDESPNNFPRLPVREGDRVVARFSDRPDPGADELLRLTATPRALGHG